MLTRNPLVLEAKGSIVSLVTNLNNKNNVCKQRACLHGGRGPQVVEVTPLAGVTRLSIYSLILI